MIIWLLAILLMASTAGLGYRQGAIRVACSFIGILLGLVLAGPLGHLIRPLFGVFGVKNPVMLWVLGPPIIFILVNIGAKLGALALHQKAEVFYKYRASELRYLLFERMNRRVGLCLGIANGALYFLIIATVIFPFSYWTYQNSSGEGDPRAYRVLDRLGADLQSSGINKVAYSEAPMPKIWYDTADLVGIIYNNPLTEARLYRYPAFLGLAERPEFSTLASDKEFASMRAQREPLSHLLDYGAVKAILDNPDLLQTVWSTLVPNMGDLLTYLETGKSPKYDSMKIVGRWNFDLFWATALIRRNNPNISSTELKKRKAWMNAAFSKTSFVAMVDHQAVLKDVPQGGPGTAPSLQTLVGQWQDLDPVKFSLGFPGLDLAATVEGDRLVIKKEGTDLAFSRED